MDRGIAYQSLVQQEGKLFLPRIPGRGVFKKKKKTTQLSFMWGSFSPFLVSLWCGTVSSGNTGALHRLHAPETQTEYSF